MLLPSTVRSWIYLRLILIFLDVCSGGYTQRSTLFKVMSVEETLPDSAIQCAARSAAEDIRHSLMNSDGVCELLKSGQTGNTTNPSVFLRKTYAKFDYHPEFSPPTSGDFLTVPFPGGLDVLLHLRLTVTLGEAFEKFMVVAIPEQKLENDIYFLISLESGSVFMNQRLSNVWTGISSSSGYPVTADKQFTLELQHTGLIVFNENSTYTYNSTSHWTGAAYLYLEAKPKDICRVHSIEYFDKN